VEKSGESRNAWGVGAASCVSLPVAHVRCVSWQPLVGDGGGGVNVLSSLAVAQGDAFDAVRVEGADDLPDVSPAGDVER
jgi:hypothetical protein